MKQVCIISLIVGLLYGSHINRAQAEVTYLGELCSSWDDGTLRPPAPAQMGVLSYGEGHYALHGNRGGLPIHGTAIIVSDKVIVSLVTSYVSSDSLISSFSVIHVEVDMATLRGSYVEMFNQTAALPPVSGAIKGTASFYPCLGLEPFKGLARRATSCVDIKNHLFLIDREMVLWDTAGSCPDNSYSVTLFGKTPDKILCNSRDSIAGPVRTCNDETKKALFDTILENLSAPDLGLGTEHTVEVVLF